MIQKVERRQPQTALTVPWVGQYTVSVRFPRP
jgi:hypothetical protein